MEQLLQAFPGALRIVLHWQASLRLCGNRDEASGFSVLNSARVSRVWPLSSPLWLSARVPPNPEYASSCAMSRLPPANLAKPYAEPANRPTFREGLVFPGTLRSNCFFRPESAIIDEQPLSSQLSSSVIHVPREIPKWIISWVRYPALWLQSFVGHCVLVIRQQNTVTRHRRFSGLQKTI